MNLWQQYLRPQTIPEAVQALISAPGPARPISGGTDLLLDLQQGRQPAVHTLVDLNSIPELSLIEQRQAELFIGAAAPLHQIVNHPLVRRHAQALVEASDLVGGPQVRNVATLGGNVAHALPAADGTIALLALGAELEIAGKAGLRRMNFKEFFLGPGKSALKQGEEILVGFDIPLIKGHGKQASCFKRIMRPQGVALPIINLAIWLIGRAEIIEDIRIAVGPGGPTPWRAMGAEKILIGKSLNGSMLKEKWFQEAREALLAEVNFRSSARRASSEYRRHLVEELFADTFLTALERAGQK
jgi:carbon-monoxide dehydrogenase medium subunit